MKNVFIDDKNALAKKAAEIISSEITRILEEKEEAVIGICGGRGVRSVFEAFADVNIPWEKVHVFWVDERLVPHDDSSSNFRVAQETFLHLVPKANIHPAKEGGYAEQLVRLGGFDIVVLSVGADGHIASLFPHHDALNREDRAFIAVDSPIPPIRRITATKALLHDAETALLLFYGEEKRDAFNAFSVASADDCPAVIVKDIKNLFIFTDIV